MRGTKTLVGREIEGLAQTLERVVGRAVVHDDDLELRIVEREERRDGRLDDRRLVVRGDDHAHGDREAGCAERLVVGAALLVAAHGILDRSDDQEHDCHEVDEHQVREAGEDDERRAGSCRHDSLLDRILDARLGGGAEALAAGGVDALEQRAPRVVERRESRRSRCPAAPRPRRSGQRGPRAQAPRAGTESASVPRPAQCVLAPPCAPTTARRPAGERARVRPRPRRRGLRRARRARGRTTRVVETATSAVPTAAPEREPSVSTTAARTFGSASHVSSISVESASPGYGRSRVAPQKRTAGSQSRRSGTRRSPGRARAPRARLRSASGSRGRAAARR